MLKEEYETLVSKGFSITGTAKEVDAFSQGKNSIGEQRLGNTKAVMIYEEQSEELIKEAQKMGLEVGNISLQDLFVYLTDEEVSL